MPVVEAAFSDLINKPTVTLQPLVGFSVKSILLRRRGDVDLVLLTADRYEQDHAIVRMAVRLFSALIRQQDLVILLDLLPEVFPWVRFLPEPDQRSFLVEFVETLRATQDLDTLAPVMQLVTEWRHTAEVYADPALLAALTKNADDLGSVPEPPTA